MTTNYLLKNNKRPQGLRGLSLRVGALAIFLLLAGLIMRPTFQVVAVKVLQPVSALRVYEIAVMDYLQSIFLSKYTLKEQVDTLLVSNAQLQEQVTILEEEKKLSGLWKEADNASSTVRQASSVLAKVVMRPPYSPFDTLVIGKGSKDYIVIGNLVYPSGRQVPIGTVDSVTSASANVVLFSAAGQSFVVTVGTSTSEWTAEGKGGGMIEAHVPRSQSVSIGQPVIMPSRSSVTFAHVEDIISRDSEPFQTIRFLLPVSFQDLDVVSINTK